MIRNYLKVAVRNLRAARAYTFINVAGLAVGIAATVFIVLYILSELSYDQFHAQGDRLYRVSVVHKKEGKVQFDSPTFTPPIGPAMKAEMPEVEQYTRMSNDRVAYFSYGDRTLRMTDVHHADSTFFQLFSFDLLRGNPDQALRDPYSLVLTATTARRLFGAEDPMGTIVKVNNQQSFQVTGVVADPPPQSSLTFSALYSFTSLYEDAGNFMDWNGGNQYVTYVLLKPSATPATLEARFPDFMWRHINSRYATFNLSLEPYLQPFERVHLFYNDYSASLRTSIYIFSVIAALILIIAGINFVNLTTARAARRAREVGVRKVLGARRRDLVRQFLGESILLTALAFVVALVLVVALFQTYERLLGQAIDVGAVVHWQHVAAFAVLLVVIGALAGSYPALYLSSVKTVNTLKGTAQGSGGGRLRNALVTFQFAISIALILCTVIVNRQLHYVNDKALGFDKENVVVFPMIGDEVRDEGSTLKAAFEGLPGVVGVAASSDYPSDNFTSNGYIPEGEENPMMIHVVDVDPDFLDVFGIDLVQGRSFDDVVTADKASYLINESLAEALGWDDPIGKTISRNGIHPVVGVVKDFHYASLHEAVAPLIITNSPWRDRFSYLSVKLTPGSTQATLGDLQETWLDVTGVVPFDFWFLDNTIDALYRPEQRFQRLFLYFSSLAILIALLGLLSLAAYATERRTKEIGIRKVMGASVTSIVRLLSRELLLLVLVANVVGWPLAYYFMQRWLEDFAYRIAVPWQVFPLVGVAVVAVAFATVGYQAMRAATMDPVKTLRYE